MRVNAVLPGITDTPMQTTFRSASYVTRQALAVDGGLVMY